MNETITIDQFKAHQKGNREKDYRQQKQTDQNRLLQKMLTKEAPELSEMKLMLKLAGIPFESEFIFHPERKWRFDIAITGQKIAIEYEGIFSAKSGHTTIDGFLKDVKKYNSATLLGWKLLRYTTKNYKDIITDLRKIL